MPVYDSVSEQYMSLTLHSLVRTSTLAPEGVRVKCGLWPRYPLHVNSTECVCSRPDNVPNPTLNPSAPIQVTQKCYWTLGSPIVGVDIGLKVDSDSLVLVCPCVPTREHQRAH